jgi:hypothetical protein
VGLGISILHPLRHRPTHSKKAAVFFSFFLSGISAAGQLSRLPISSLAPGNNTHLHPDCTQRPAVLRRSDDAMRRLQFMSQAGLTGGRADVGLQSQGKVTSVEPRQNFKSVISFCLTPLPLGVREVRGYLSGEAGTNRQQLDRPTKPHQVSHIAVTAKELNPKNEEEKTQEIQLKVLSTHFPPSVLYNASAAAFSTQCLPRCSVGRDATGELRGGITERSVITHRNGTYQSAAEIPVLGCK